MKLKIENRNLAVTLVLGAGAVGYIFLLFLPTQNKIAQLQDELAHHQSYIAQKQDSNVTLASLNSELEATRTFADEWLLDAPRV